MTASGLPKPPNLTVGEALRQGAAALAEAGREPARLTAEVLLARALGRPRVYLYAHPEEPLSELAWIHYGRWLYERSAGKPLQYITREQEFYGRDFTVGPGVLIPRPETEHLIERALASPPPAGPVIDIGTGSGAIAITLALEWRRPVIAIDLSPAALAIAQANARRLDAPVAFVQMDLLSAVAPASAALLVTNPPYVPSLDQPTLQSEVRDWEPPEALFSGPDGLDHYRRLARDARRALLPGGHLIGEFGQGQTLALREIFREWANIEIFPDLAGIDRILHVTC